MNPPVVPANTSWRTRAVEGGRVAIVTLLLGAAVPEAPRYADLTRLNAIALAATIIF